MHSNRSNRRSTLAAACAVSLILCLGPSAAFAEPPEWDQERVSGIAQELVAALKDLQIAVRQNDQLMDSGARASKYRARQDLRLLISATRGLVADLKAGHGQEATRPAYKRMQTLRRDAEENARRGMIPEATLEKIAGCQDLLQQLAPYYKE
jgi:hypothetical protein